VSKCWKQKNRVGEEMARATKVCSVWVHRTVRWCTGQCPVRQAGSREKAALGTSTAVYGYKSPDCPVGRSQANSSFSGIHRRRTTIIHRTVRCAPDCPVSQRSAGPTVGQAGSREKAALGTSTAVYDYKSPDCPVVHRTVRWAVHRRTRRSREFIVDVRL
jgi:hypothetical protein